MQKDCPCSWIITGVWSRVVAKCCYPFPNPNHWNQEYPAEPRWPGPNKNLLVVALVSHVETAQLGLVGCSLMLYFHWWRDDAGPHWPQLLQHTPCCTFYIYIYIYIYIYCNETFNVLHMFRLETEEGGLYVRATNVSVSSGVLVQGVQVRFLPHARKCEVVSQPVKRWKRGSASDFDGPRLEQMMWIGMSR